MSITQRGGMIKDDNNVPIGYLYKNITSQTTTLIKTGAGFLHSVTFNKPVATGTTELDDAITNASPKIGTITTPASPLPVTLTYDISFSDGLSVTTGVADQDITISYI